MKKTVAFSRAATNVFFHITTRCNLRCRHCYIDPAAHGDNTLSLSTIETRLSAFSGNRTANAVFLGGEPTLHPQLAEAVRAARRLGYASITIDTNGGLFHDILSKLDPAEVDYFSFSLDGALSGTNDRLRGAGSYETCLSGIRNARKKGFSVSMIYTVCTENLAELRVIGPLLGSLGIDRFFIQVLGLRGNARKEDLHQVSRREWLSVVPEAAGEIASSCGIPVVYPRVFLDPDAPFDCAGRSADNYFLFPNGRVYRCPLCEDYPIHGMEFGENGLTETGRINETDLFRLDIPEGCVMNRLLHPENLSYREGKPEYKIACCMLKEEIGGRSNDRDGRQ
jgi:MoaA/NifB/PqqE/SkfB family radical SAM enzyme